MSITAINRNGRSYVLAEVPEGTRISLQGKNITVPFPISQITHSWALWLRGEYIQHAFSYLTADEREFLITGLTSEEWDRMFPLEEDR